MIKYLIIGCLLFPLGVLSQDKKALRTGWRVISTAGLIAGETDSKPLFQLSGGVVRTRHFAGIGVAYDMYRFNSFPVFADYRIDVGKNRMAFLYGHIGYNFPGHHKEEAEFSKLSDRLKGGFFMDAGIGYRIRLGTFHRLSFSAGYSRKDIRHIKTYTSYCITGDCPDEFSELKYSLGRMVAKMSWELGY